MKYVPAPAVEKIRILNLHDQPMFNGIEQDQKSENFGQPKPLYLEYQEWLRTRTTDEAFYEAGGKKEGADALELVMLARQQIKETGGVSGSHAFDDEVAKRLRAAILKPKNNKGFMLGPDLEHNLYDWVQLWKPEPKGAPPAVLNSPEPESEKSQ